MRSTLFLICWMAAWLCQAATVQEDFAQDPLAHGWRVFGNTNLFHWNSANRNLEVTFDSSQTNSFFYYPLTRPLTRLDGFKVEFDLNLSDITSGSESGKDMSMEFGFGFLNYTAATSPTFGRGVFGKTPNVVEFDYFGPGYSDDYGEIAATAMPAFISGVNTSHIAPKSNFTAYIAELPLNQVVHVTFAFNATNQYATVSITANGSPIAQLPGLLLNAASGFQSSDDYNVNMFSVSSYSSYGDSMDSVLAHGTVDNIVVTIFPRPDIVLTGTVAGNGRRQIGFNGATNWFYTLERTEDLRGTWKEVTPSTVGTGTNMFLQDTNALTTRAFYRVKAHQQL